jgi:hypothetical protein
MMHLEDARFWQMPAQPDGPVANDGAQWIFQGYKDGYYHVVDRQLPETGEYRERVFIC